MLKTAAAKITWVGRTASMVFGLALVMALCSCGSGSQETKTHANSTPNVIEGRFDVGDYKLYMRCEGSGSPTVVYFHGFIEEPAGGGARNAGEIPSMLRDKHRICATTGPMSTGATTCPGSGRARARLRTSTGSSTRPESSRPTSYSALPSAA